MTFITTNQTLKKVANKTFVTHVQGKSMSPLINPNDLVQMRMIGPTSIININDIVVFLNDSQCLSHRVIGKNGSNLLIKGDNVSTVDRLVHYSEILGIVVKIDGKYGTINLESKSTKIIQHYFLFRSIILLHTPTLLYNLVSKILFGRKLLIIFCIIFCGRNIKN